MPEIISVNVALPRTIERDGRTVTTGIFKEPVEGRVAVAGNNLEGDAQADLRVHGGADKAVYVYPSEHYPFWREALGRTLEWGAFGENLTTGGLIEDEVSIGDRFRIGTAILMVTQPREPCSKLALKLETDDIVPRFRASSHSGFYLAIVTEGELGAGDAIERIHRDPAGVRVADVHRLHQNPGDRDLLRRVLAVEALAESQRIHFEKRLRRL